MSLKSPHPVDVYVGNRLRLKRIILGLSQQDLGATVGITFQQIQKYEKGQNRMGSSRLYNFACTLETDVGYFFYGIEDTGNDEPSECNTSNDRYEISVGEAKDTLVGNDKEILLLIRYYKAIEDGEMRRKILSMVRGVAQICENRCTKSLIRETVD